MVEPVSQIGLAQIGLGLAGIVVALVVGGILVRILKRTISGCLATGVGCLVMVVGVIAVGLYLASRAGIHSLSDIVALLLR